MAYLFRWKSPNPDIEQDLAAARTELIKLRRRLRDREQFIARLKMVVQQRSNTIDDQRGRLAQSQAQIQQLNNEADHLAEMVRVQP